MTEPLETLANTESNQRAGVTINRKPLPPPYAGALMRVVVDNDVLLPGMFELTFLDSTGELLAELGIVIGSEVAVTGLTGSGTAAPLIVGEVTAIEGLLQGVDRRTMVRGYTKAHRLQRVRRSRTFLNSTDADVAKKVAEDAGLRIGVIAPTPTAHAYLAQVNQTDWEFLSARAQEIGFELGVQDNLFYFRPFADISAAGGLPGGGSVSSAVKQAGRSILADVVAGATGAGGGGAPGGPVTISYPEKLIAFRPRVTAGNLTPDVEVRVWDPMSRKAIAQGSAPAAETVPSPAALGTQFTAGGSGLGGSVGRAVDSVLTGGVSGVVDAAIDTAVDVAASAIVPGGSGPGNLLTGLSNAVLPGAGGLLGSPVGDLGPPPSPTAHVVVDKPFADAVSMATSGPQVAGALGGDHGSTFAEAEGEAKGNASIQPGCTVDIQGVQEIFAGQWLVSRARHVFDDSEFGYRVIFSAHGRQDRTVLGLTSKSGRSSSGGGVLDGVVCGVVSNSADPRRKGRVKVTLPWLSPDFETDWAPVGQFYSGQRGGAIHLPEIGDEVLLAFEFSDVRRPYVLGAFMNDLTKWSIAASGPIAALGLATMPLQPPSVAEGGAGGGLLNVSPLGGPMKMADMASGAVEGGFDAATGQGEYGILGATAPGVALGAFDGAMGSGGGGGGGLPGMPGGMPGMPGMPGLPGMPGGGSGSGGGGGGSGGGGSGGGGSGGGGSGGGGGLPGMDLAGQIAGTTVAPGMISEVNHRGMVSNTGNALLFYDVPPPLPVPSVNGAAKALGVDLPGGGASPLGAGASPVGGPGMGAVASACRLGTQNGMFGMTIDQLNGGISINAMPIPGVTRMPVPTVGINAFNGLVNIAAGPAGGVNVAGAVINMTATGGMTITAPIINFVGLVCLNGVPIPL